MVACTTPKKFSDIFQFGGFYTRGLATTLEHQKQTAQEFTNLGGFFAQGKRCLISRRLIVWERTRRHLSKQDRVGHLSKTACTGSNFTTGSVIMERGRGREEAKERGSEGEGKRG